VNALDYLLKPFSYERFRRALCRAKERIAGKLDPEETCRIIAALESIRTQNAYLERSAVSRLLKHKRLTGLKPRGIMRGFIPVAVSIQSEKL
jgi:DNA-binding LytR/AlgR family response regulator